MELHQVRYFVALCNTLNFTRAAEACNVTQPALTRAIQRLEEELGGPLFQRERNLTQLTELGRLMRPPLEQALSAAESAKIFASRFRKTEVASLRLGLVPSLSPLLAAAALPELMRRIPTVEVEMRTLDQRSLTEELLQGTVDAALLVDDGALPERLNSWVLFKETYRLAFVREHRLAALEAIPLAALEGEIILGRLGCSGVSALCAQCGAAGAGITVRHVADTEAQLQHLAALALGLALVPQHLEVLPALVTRPLTDAVPQRAVALTVVGGRRYSPALDAFIRLSRARDFAADLAA